MNESTPVHDESTVTAAVGQEALGTPPDIIANTGMGTTAPVQLAAPNESVSPVVQGGTRVAFCIHCGMRLIEGARFCAYCGQSTSSDMDVKPMTVVAIFCALCVAWAWADIFSTNA